jgi:ribosomal-protein-alanine N-acetyltransferase
MPGWELITERLRLRRITLDDADLTLALWNDPAFVRNVGDRGVRTEEQARKKIEAGALQLYANYGYGPYVVEFRSSRERIGICGLFKRDNLDDPDIGFALLPEFCRQGYAEEAAQAVVDHARDDLAAGTLTAIVSPHNAASIRLIEKLGLRFCRMITMPGDEEAICLYSMALGKEWDGVLQQ